MSEKKELVGTLNIFKKNLLSNLHTMTIAKIIKVEEKTIDCAPVINRSVNDKSIRLPNFIKVPPVFIQGGDSYTAHPISVGDYCLLLICERSFDQWYNGVDFQVPINDRTHDYSDAFAFVGINPLGSSITIPEKIIQKGDAQFDGDQTINGNLTLNGNFIVNGNITCTGVLTLDGVNINEHIHGGVTTGGGVTGAPI